MTPAERLALSRLAIIEHLERRERRHDPHSVERDEPRAKHNNGMARPPRRAGRGWFGGAVNAAKTWWNHHPAQLALELATPALQSYARRKPFQLLGISAAFGAALVLTRPWRLVSLTSVLIAVVKSSQLTSVVMAALTDASD